MVRNGDEKKRVALLEFGWTSDPRPNSPYRWHRVTEEEKGDYIVRAFRFAKENWYPWIGMMTLVYIANPQLTEEQEQYHWSITYPDGRPRQAYEAVKRMSK